MNNEQVIMGALMVTAELVERRKNGAELPPLPPEAIVPEIL
jgi:hypothetical protein